MRPLLLGLVLSLLAAPSAVGADPGDPPRTPDEIREWLATPTPARPELPDDVAAHVAELEMRVAELRGVEAFEEAIALAEGILAIRGERQSGWTTADGTEVEWWELGDARRLVQDLRDLAALAPEDRMALAQADRDGERMNEAFRRGAYAEAARSCNAELAARRRVLGDGHPDTLTSISNMGSLLDAQNRLAEAEPYYREVVDGFRRVLGDDHPSTLASIHKMGFLLKKLGKLAEAEPYSREALESRRRVLGDDHPHTLTSMNNMGLLLEAQGKPAEAETYYRESLDACRRAFGDDHPSTLASINNMGSVLYAQGKLAEAEPFYRQSVDGCRRVLGDDHLGTLSSISNLGSLLYGQGKLAEAETYSREALDGCRRMFGDDHPSTLNSLNNMGALLAAQGKLAEAETYFGEALDGFRRTLGDNHPSTLRSINNMGFMLEGQGKLASARRYYREALDGRRRVLGDHHSDTLLSVSSMGFLLNAQGKPAEAEPYYREALDGCRRVLGDDHPNTLASINNMGGLLVAQGKVVDAEPYYREALARSRRLLGDDHPNTLASINNMGGLLEAQGKFTDAEPYFREALDGRRRELGEDHPSTLNSINNMGGLLEAQGRLTDAEPYYREALDASRRVLGDDHPSTLLSINNMGFLLGSLGKHAAAEPYSREALESRRRVLGDDHPSTLISLNNMGFLLEGQGKLADAERYYREALDVAERLRGQATGGEEGRAAMAQRTGLRAIAGSLAHLLTRMGHRAEAWTVAERGRSRALLDLLARSELRITGLAPDPVRFAAAQEREHDARVTLTTAEARMAALRTERATIDRLGDDDRAARLASFDEQLDAQHDLILRARRDLGEATAGVFLELRTVMPDAQSMTAETIRAALAPRELVLGYVWTDDAVVLLTIDARAEPTATIVADGADAVTTLTGSIAVVRAAMSERPQSNWAQGARETAAALVATLLPEAARPAIADAERVVVLPDGPLAGLPFEALAFDQGEPLLNDERVQVVYASSATVYLNRRHARETPPSAGTAALVALGDPVFDGAEPREPEYPTAGVLVNSVVEGGNAAAAGLARGDVLLAYAGTEIRDFDHMLELKAAATADVEGGTYAADDALPVRYWRDGEVHATTMIPGAFGANIDSSPPVRGLRAMAVASRGMDDRVAESSMLDFVRLHGGGLSRLPGTRDEVEHIGAIGGAVGADARTLLDTNATLAELELAVPGARYVHIATHGLTGSADRPYDASLALTMPESPSSEDIGFLTLDHLIRTWRGKLDACDLVVLSACDTQRGVRSGDSVMALPWGFFFAGAPTVVASLWQVDDRATSILMGRFYENLLGAHEDERTILGRTYGSGASMTKGDALQEAKRWLRTWDGEALLADADTRGVRRRAANVATEGAKRRPYAHPYYWAAFVLVGDPG